MAWPIGKTYDGGTWTVEAGQPLAYAEATDDPNPAYRGDEAIAPPMFHVRPLIGLMLACARDPELAIDMLRLVHGEHAMTFHRPVVEGDVLALSAELLSVDEKASGTIFAFGLTAAVDGTPVCSGRTAYFVRAKSPPPKGPKKDRPAKEPPPPPDFTVEQPVSEDQAVRYALASGDDNPIHTDEDVAKKAGLPRTILHGLCTMAFAQRDLIARHGGDPRDLMAIEARFTGMVLPGQTLVLKGWEDGDAIRFQTDGPNGKPVLMGEARFR